MTNHVESLRLQNFNVKEIYMQKKLIALAIAGLSGAAFAQSNVTVYGVADVSYDFMTAGGGTANAAANTAVTGIASKSRIATNASYFGLKGAEDLGGGMKAVYQIENEFDMGSAQSVPGAGNSRPSGLANRDSFVGLAGAFGTVAAGFLSSPHRSMAAKFDLMPGAAGSASSLNIIGRINTGSAAAPLVNGYASARFGTAASLTPNTVLSQAVAGVAAPVLTTTAGAAETVATNVGIISRHAAVAYITPNFNGFVGTIAYVANETKDNAQLGGAANSNAGTYAQRNPRAWNIKFDYDNGPLSLGYSYIDIKDTGVLGNLTATNATNQGSATTAVGGGLVQLGLSGRESHKGHLFGAKYTFGGATTVSFMYDRTKSVLEAGPAAATLAAIAGDTGDIGIKRSNWYLGVKHSMGMHDFSAVYAKAGKNSVSSSGNRLRAANDYEGGSDASMWGLRYGYNFSKRTQAYAQYAAISNGSNASYDFGVGGTNVTGTGNAGTAVGADPRTVSFGIRHNF